MNKHTDHWLVDRRQYTLQVEQSKRCSFWCSVTLALWFRFIVRVSRSQKIACDAMYQVLISRYRLADVSHGKPYYVYCVEVLESESGTRYFIERRYSEFSALHRTVRYFINFYWNFNSRRAIISFRYCHKSFEYACLILRIQNLNFCSLSLTSVLSLISNPVVLHFLNKIFVTTML